MHLMTAFYAVIVLTLAVEWKLPAEQLLALYAPATILLVMSLPAGWASDRFGAPVMMVVMFFGLGFSSIVCGLLPAGNTWALSAGLCGLGIFGAVYHSVGIGWIIRTAKAQGHAMGVNGLWGSAGLGLYGIVPGVLITLISWRAAFILPGIVCLALGVALWLDMVRGRVGDRPMPQPAGAQPGRREFWRVFSVLSVTMSLEGIIWQAVLFGAAFVFESYFPGNLLLIGAATSAIYIISGFAQYGLGRTIIDRFPLKNTYVVASALQIAAMLALAAGNLWLALAGAVFSAVLSSASGPVENILIARYTPSRFHGLGFGAKFVVAFGAAPLAILAIAWIRETTGSLDLFFLGLAALSAVIAAVALLLPGNDRSQDAGASAPAPVPAE